MPPGTAFIWWKVLSVWNMLRWLNLLVLCVLIHEHFIERHLHSVWKLLLLATIIIAPWRRILHTTYSLHSHMNRGSLRSKLAWVPEVPLLSPSSVFTFKFQSRRWPPPCTVLLTLPVRISPFTCWSPLKTCPTNAIWPKCLVLVLITPQANQFFCQLRTLFEVMLRHLLIVDGWVLGRTQLRQLNHLLRLA